MRCARCAAPLDPGDNFCRRCGSHLNRRNLPTVVTRSILPVPWTLARGPVMRGLAALAVGAAIELGRRQLSRRLLAPAAGDGVALLAPAKAGKLRRSLLPWSKPPRGEYEVTETVVQRTVRFFRR